MTNPIGHFEIIGRDPIALQRFYAEVFGWKMSPPAPEMGNYSLIDNEGKGVGGGIGGGDPRVTLYIEVDDPQRYLDRVVEAGATQLMPVTPIMEGVTIAMFADPAGNTIGLLKASPQ